MTTPEPPKQERLSRWEIALAATAAALAVTAGTFGLILSFSTVSSWADTRGFKFPPLVPLAVDFLIPASGVAYVLLVRLDIPLWWLRYAPWALTGVTVFLNIPKGSEAGIGEMVGHAAMPAVWAFVTEVFIHVYRAKRGIRTGRRMESIRWARWLLAPVPTFRLWRRMKLWELRSYDQVLKLERERIAYRDHLRSRYGWAWRRTAPVESRMPLRLAKYGVPLAETAPAGLAAAGIKPTAVTPDGHAAEATEVTATVERASTPTGGPTEPPALPHAEEVPSLRALLPARQAAYAAEEVVRKPREEVTARIPEEVPLLPPPPDLLHHDNDVEEVEEGLANCAEEVLEEVPLLPPPPDLLHLDHGTEEVSRAALSTGGEIDIAPQVTAEEVPAPEPTEEATEDVLRKARTEAQKWAQSPEGIALREEIRKQLLALLDRAEEVSPADFAREHPHYRVTRKYVADQLKWARAHAHKPTT
ncbi:DUF2637 domain-containing protein [Streptomyces sp. cg36]|uniref:DUF2637 domain-containing protein n=1 Tax=Streptomyces sp. cg36 TaxID=3238798 RepID=UPI0034E25478